MAAREVLLKRYAKSSFGAGVYRQLSDAEIAERQRKAEEQRRLAQMLDARQCRNLPPGYGKANLDDLAALPLDAQEPYSRALDRLNRIVARDRDKPFIAALIGVIGAGKTHMAAALINKFASLGRTARYTTAMDYILAIRSTYGKDTEQSQIENAHIHPELLVIDEMQVRGETAHEDLLLIRLIDKRYQHNRATLLISNHLTKQEFAERVDARIMDRMNTAGGVCVVSWPSIRGRLKG